MWWTIWGDPDRPDPFHDALLPMLRAKAPQLIPQGGVPLAYAQDADARAAEIDRVGRFGAVESHVLNWEGQHDPVSLRRLFATFSPWIALPDPVRAELLDDVERLAREEFQGVVRRPYQTVAYLAQRLSL